MKQNAVVSTVCTCLYLGGGTEQIMAVVYLRTGRIFILILFFATSGKWELTELETDGALDGDIGLVMSVRGTFPIFPSTVPLYVCI